MKKLLWTLLLASFWGCKNSDQPDNKPEEKQTPIISYSIIDSFPHDTSSFTQGLQIYNGKLYEGTGEFGRSKLLAVDLKTGKIQQQVSIDPKFFGEGITILRDTVYQLTWKNNKVLVYTLKDFKLIKEFPIETEGWGITTDGKRLIVSDGTSNLFYYDPANFKLLQQQTVTEGNSLAFNLNELEYIEGYVYANQWQAPYILKIDPSNGQIVGKIDLNDIWNRTKEFDPHSDVPNGIAYDSSTKKMYVTGKLWPTLYQIQLSQ